MARERRCAPLAQMAGMVLVLGLVAGPAAAQVRIWGGDDKEHQGKNRLCSIESVAGTWMFATGVGQQLLIPGQDGDITAIGTMHISAKGDVSGVFDVTVADFMFNPDQTYTGTLVVGPDCRGTLSFVTGTGSMRIDSMAILDQNEMWGMSRDPANLWTYQVRRVSRTPGRDR